MSSIPEGSVVSYGEVARRAGLPRRARLVGAALGAAPREMQLPWHRVILASGRIAFPPGSRLFKRQAELLLRDGVEVDSRGKVIAPLSETSLDSQLWGPE